LAIKVYLPHMIRDYAPGSDMATKRDSDNLRRAGKGASVIVLRRDAVLMVKRARPPSEGLWSFPAGRIEPGETSEENSRRELREETGLNVGRLFELGAFRPSGAPEGFRLIVFAARFVEGVPVAGDDALLAEFVPFHAVLARPVTPGAPGWIARALMAISDPPLAGCGPATPCTEAGPVGRIGT
jgi:ADP-ribose pyrophosphatase YjhB (NUDIX family)